MTSAELQANLRKARNELNSSRYARAQKYALDMTARVKRRVINEGLDHEGHAFGVYKESTRKHRRKANLTASPYPKINFKDTSRMWTNTKGVADNSPVPEIYIGPTSNENVSKLAWNEDRFGEIMTPSDQEITSQAQIEAKRITKILKKHNIL